jgi:hypothetical protein
MSMIENLTSINKLGIQEFVKQENQKWRCRQCGEVLCVHKPECSFCRQIWNQRQMKNEVINQEDSPDQKAVR